MNENLSRKIWTENIFFCYLSLLVREKRINLFKLMYLSYLFIILIRIFIIFNLNFSMENSEEKNLDIHNEVEPFEETGNCAVDL